MTDCRTNSEREECPLGSVSDWRVAFTIRTLGGGSGTKMMRVVARSPEDALSRGRMRLAYLGIIRLDSGSAEELAPYRDSAPPERLFGVAAERLGIDLHCLALRFAVDVDNGPRWTVSVPTGPCDAEGDGGTPAEAFDDLERLIRRDYPWMMSS